MSEPSLAHLSLQELVALAYGTRARLADLQSIRQSGDRSLDLQRLLDDANRAVDDADKVLIDLAIREAETGWLIFSLIKATHNGSIQRLSQRIKDVLSATSSPGSDHLPRDEPRSSYSLDTKQRDAHNMAQQ